MSYRQWRNLCEGAAQASVEHILNCFSLSFGAVAVASTVLCFASLAIFIMYVRLPPHAKAKMWSLYGWFIGSICVSALMSATAWGAGQGLAGSAFKDDAFNNSTSAPHSWLMPPPASSFAWSHRPFCRLQDGSLRQSDLNTYPGNPSIMMFFVFRGLAFSG